jgi:hypothetical protein
MWLVNAEMGLDRSCLVVVSRKQWSVRSGTQGIRTRSYYFFIYSMLLSVAVVFFSRSCRFDTIVYCMARSPRQCSLHSSPHDLPSTLLEHLLLRVQFPQHEFSLSIRLSSRWIDARIQDTVPSTPALFTTSIRNQFGNGSPILGTVLSHGILQLAVFVCCPFTIAYHSLGNTGIQGIAPPIPTLPPRSIRN